MFVAIDGIDGSGKDTQVKLLAEKLHPALIVQCPNRNTSTGAIIDAFLSRKAELPRMAEVAQYEANRWEWEPRLRVALAGGKLVIANRWFHSGMAYALPDGKEYFDAVLALDRGLTIPDLSFIIDIPPEEAMKRKERKDKFESNLEYLSRVRSAFLTLAKQYDWKVIDGVRQPSQIQDSIQESIHAAQEKTSMREDSFSSR